MDNRRWGEFGKKNKPNKGKILRTVSASVQKVDELCLNSRGGTELSES